MGKLYLLTLAMLYIFGCAFTMPSTCWTLKNAVTCQRVQLQSFGTMRMVSWDSVDAIRHF